MTALASDVRELSLDEINQVSGGPGRVIRVIKVIVKIISMTGDLRRDTPEPERPEPEPEAPKEN